ncbi:hypothetical protein TWF970_004779 [Orbilia oligospora]|uniref:Uncharacterized protein n=1 Tax=Orbilia oligospora TaxID=2813651 RepID=A0A7C8VN35_ORBOL|nr:hypothetical protein TWF970_004779 [Orbilia oligospora]
MAINNGSQEDDMRESGKAEKHCIGHLSTSLTPTTSATQDQQYDGLLVKQRLKPWTSEFFNFSGKHPDANPVYLLDVGEQGIKDEGVFDYTPIILGNGGLFSDVTWIRGVTANLQTGRYFFFQK